MMITLFSKYDLNLTTQSKIENIKRNIDSIPQREFSAKTDEILINQLSLVNEYKIPTLNTENIDITSQDEVIENAPTTINNPFGGRTRVTEFTIKVPFTGDKTLFEMQTNSMSSMMPRAKIHSDAIYLIYRGKENAKEYHNDINAIESYLSTLRNLAQNENDKLKNVIATLIKNRRLTLQQNLRDIEDLKKL